MGGGAGAPVALLVEVPGVPGPPETPGGIGADPGGGGGGIPGGIIPVEAKAADTHTTASTASNIPTDQDKCLFTQW